MLALWCVDAGVAIQMPYVLSHPVNTSRLTLRRVESRDLDPLFTIHGDPSVTRYIPHVHGATRVDGEAWMARVHDRHDKQTAIQCAVVRRATADAPEAVLGTTLLFNFEEASGRADIGYILGKAFWGQGYMREALTAFIDCAFNELGLRRLEATVDARNEASNRIAQRLGFVREGLLRERWLAAGELQDIHLFALLKREWPPGSVARR